jgi:DNA-binding winged helix-turn-helix (wHTH) protein
MRFQFGDCTFDSGTRELLRGGRAVGLGPKALRLLEVLLERRPLALSKQQLQELVWPDSFVSEASLARLATELRAAIGDKARDPRFVRTVYGFGYAFAGEAIADQPASPAARRSRFRIVLGALEIPLGEGENVLGRGEDATVFIDSTKASRKHARILIAGVRATLEDLGSKNGTFLRGRRVAVPTALHDGDELIIGPVLMTFRVGASGSTETDEVSGAS